MWDAREHTARRTGARPLLISRAYLRGSVELCTNSLSLTHPSFSCSRALFLSSIYRALSLLSSLSSSREALLRIASQRDALLSVVTPGSFQPRVTDKEKHRQ